MSLKSPCSGEEVRRYAVVVGQGWIDTARIPDIGARKKNATDTKVGELRNDVTVSFFNILFISL